MECCVFVLHVELSDLLVCFFSVTFQYNMIKRLQEAANYSSSQSGQDDDSASICSRSSSVQDLSTSSVESTI